MKWTALFSQTGSEIYQISERLGRYPDVIICNKQGDLDEINLNLIGKSFMIFTASKPTVRDYLEYIKEDDFVTMHGWLRIVPSEICEKRTIYNGHPGLITKYPELKGKDPQEKAFNLKHDTAGCVIHEAVAEVDAGKILAESEIDIKDKSLDEVYGSLHKLSTDLWVDFLRDKFNV